MYREGRIELHFPPSARAQGGATRSYTLRERAGNGAIAFEAVCVIPATRAAAEMMDRRFGVRRDRPSSGGEGEVGTLDYELEPIVVDGGSHCSDPSWTRGEDGVCRSTRGGGTGGGGGEGGTAYADDGTRDGTGDCPTCVPHDPAKHRAKYDEALSKIDQNKCPDLYAAAAGVASHFVVWTEERFKTGTQTKILGEFFPYSELAGGPSPDTFGFWETHLLYGTEFPITVAHEAAHAIDYGDDPEGTPLSQNPAEVYAKSCLL